MFNFFKRFFKKKIQLPFWFLIYGRPTKFENFESYKMEMDKIVEALMEDKEVVCRVNGKVCIIYKEGKEVKIQEVKEEDIEYVW